MNYLLPRASSWCPFMQIKSTLLDAFFNLKSNRVKIKWLVQVCRDSSQRRRKWRRTAINIQQQVQGSASLPLLCNMSEAQDGIIRPQIASSMWGWSFPEGWRRRVMKGRDRGGGWWKQNGGKMRMSTRCFMVLSGGRFLFSPPSVAAVRFYDQVKTLAGAAPSGWFNGQRRPTLIFQFASEARHLGAPASPSAEAASLCGGKHFAS